MYIVSCILISNYLKEASTIIYYWNISLAILFNWGFWTLYAKFLLLSTIFSLSNVINNRISVLSFFLSISFSVLSLIFCCAWPSPSMCHGLVSRRQWGWGVGGRYDIPRSCFVQCALHVAIFGSRIWMSLLTKQLSNCFINIFYSFFQIFVIYS